MSQFQIIDIYTDLIADDLEVNGMPDQRIFGITTSVSKHILLFRTIYVNQKRSLLIAIICFVLIMQKLY